MNKKIFVLYTGGTIGMVQTAEGLAPDTALAGKAFADQPDVSFTWHICEPLIDSSAVSLHNWQEWLLLLQEAVEHYDGILVLHGTDTLAYTANMLALSMPNIDVPIVLTGSQWPLGIDGSDASANLDLALSAATSEVSGVWLAFNHMIMPAIGSSKVSTETADGFVNAHFGRQTLQDWRKAQQDVSVRKEAFCSKVVINPDVRIICLTFIPGCSIHFIADVLAQGWADGYILQTFGHGNAPDSKVLIDAIAKLNAAGKFVINISQVLQGQVSAVYAQGEALRRAGLIGGGRANVETATALLTLAISNHWSVAEVENYLARLQLK